MCSQCNGEYLNCPICETPKVWEQCPKCGGAGIEAYFTAAGGQTITATKYALLPPYEREADICTLCNGEGQVEQYAK